MASITSYRSPKVKLREGSKIANKGIFAKEKIKNGEIIAIKNGYIMDRKEFDRLPLKCKIYCTQIDDDFFVGPKKFEEIERNGIFINHSCDPNTCVRGQIAHVAIRDIDPGEELTLDYATLFTEMISMADVKCNCGSKNCRQAISGDDWKLKELRERYGDGFAEYLLRKIKCGFY